VLVVVGVSVGVGVGARGRRWCRGFADATVGLEVEAVLVLWVRAIVGVVAVADVALVGVAEVVSTAGSNEEGAAVRAAIRAVQVSRPVRSVGPGVEPFGDGLPVFTPEPPDPPDPPGDEGDGPATGGTEGVPPSRPSVVNTAASSASAQNASIGRTWFAFKGLSSRGVESSTGRLVGRSPSSTSKARGCGEALT